MEFEDLESALATVHNLLIAEAMPAAAALVSQYSARVEQTHYDNWNGGTYYWTIFFDVPAHEYARLGAQRIVIEGQIDGRLKDVFLEEENHHYNAKISVAKAVPKDWRAEGSTLPREVRKNIVDGMRLDDVHWQGALNDVEFLSRLYDLDQLPSTDRRYLDASGDIWQHTVNNDDWDADWVFTDARFALLGGPMEKFLRFLCETVHPVVRPDREVAMRMVEHFNDQLRPAGWELVEEERIGGRPRFTFRPFTHQGARAVSRARKVANALEAGSMARQIERLESAIDSDPDLAIGTAKELIETCCKTILDHCGVEYSRGMDIGDLTKLVIKTLDLVPDNISEQARGANNIRLILRNLTSIPHHLAELRGMYGTGHGPDGKHRGLQPRHARLAVSTAVAFIDFVSQTYRDRERSKT